MDNDYLRELEELLPQLEKIAYCKDYSDIARIYRICVSSGEISQGTRNFTLGISNMLERILNLEKTEKPTSELRYAKEDNELLVLKTIRVLRSIGNRN